MPLVIFLSSPPAKEQKKDDILFSSLFPSVKKLAGWQTGEANLPLATPGLS